LKNNDIILSITNKNFMQNIIKQIFKQNIKYTDFVEFIVGEILPRLKKVDDCEEHYEEVITDVLNSLQKKFSRQLISLDNIKEEILNADFVEKIDITDIEGDAIDTKEVDFGSELKEYIQTQDFEHSLEDYFEDFSIVNIQC